jgi:hypothetical protein
VGQYVKTLELKGMEPEQAIAEQILEHTTSLKSFIYRIEVQCNHDGLGTWPNAQNLTRALANVGLTLEHLEVTHQFQDDLFGLMGPFFPRALLFTDLVVLGLSRLSIEYSPQMSEDYQWQAGNVLRVLEKFVDGKKWKNTTPSLDTITVNDMIWSPDKGQQEKSREAARVVVGRNGLQYFASRVGI